MKSQNEVAKKMILEIMLDHVGVENAITDKVIRELVIVSDPDVRKPTAGLRDIINALRQEGNPICSGLVGYYTGTPKTPTNSNRISMHWTAEH